MEEDSQIGMFSDEDMEKSWMKHWRDLPAWEHQDRTPFQQVIVSVDNKEGLIELAKVLDHKLTYQTTSVWFPKKELVETKIYINDGTV